MQSTIVGSAISYDYTTLLYSVSHTDKELKTIEYKSVLILKKSHWRDGSWFGDGSVICSRGLWTFGNPHDCCALHLAIYFGSIWTAANKRLRSHTVKASGSPFIKTHSLSSELPSRKSISNPVFGHGAVA